MTVRAAVCPACERLAALALELGPSAVLVCSGCLCCFHPTRVLEVAEAVACAGACGCVVLEADGVCGPCRLLGAVPLRRPERPRPSPAYAGWLGLVRPSAVPPAPRAFYGVVVAPCLACGASVALGQLGVVERAGCACCGEPRSGRARPG